MSRRRFRQRTPSQYNADMTRHARSITLTGDNLTLADAERILAGEVRRLAISPDARRRVRRSRQCLEQLMSAGRTIYGVNTGFGKLSNQRIEPDELLTLQVNLLRSHAVGVGSPLGIPESRLAMALRLQALNKGYSGVTPALIDMLLQMFNRGVVPVIPEQGSVGASGDLAPLAHMALVVMGEGEAYVVPLGRPERPLRPVTGAAALRQVGLKPHRLQPKEGISLINGTQVSCAVLVQAWVAARHLATIADVAAAMTLEATRSSLRPFDPRVHCLRPHPGQQLVADNVRRLLDRSGILPSHADCPKVQDAYCIRCVPQVHGTFRDALVFVGETLERELNAATDNPLVFADTSDVISAGNFHGQPLALAADVLAAAVTDLASIAERRVENLVNPDLSGLPGFLTPHPGLNSGMMLIQVLAAALVSECKSLSHPASVDSIPTSANREDHVSMSTHAARKARMIVDNATRVLACELLCAAQGLDFLKPLRPGRGAAAAYDCLRQHVRHLGRDRILHRDIETVTRLMTDGVIEAAVREQCPELA